MKTKIIQLVIAVLFVSIAVVGQANTYNVTICQGSDTTIGHVWSGGIVYWWNTNPIQYGSSITVNPSNNQQYIVTILDVFSNIMGHDTFNIVVNPTPYVGISSSGGQTIVCPGDSLQLICTSNPSPLDAYQWSNGANTMATNVTPTNSPTIYSVIGTEDGCSDTATFIVTIQPNPTPYQITGNSTYCPGQFGVVIGLSGSQVGIMYKLWHNGVWTGTALGTGNAISFGMIANASGSYTATGETNLGCLSNMIGTLNVTPTLLPAAAGAITGPTAICAGSNQSYSVAPISGATSYAWSITNGSIISGTGTTNIVVNWTGNGTLSVAGTGFCGNGPNSALNVVVYPAPTVSISPNTPHVCNGDTANFTANGASTYNWSMGLTGSNISFVPVQTMSVSVIGISQYGCISQPVGTMLYVEPIPSFTLLGPTSPACAGDDVYLDAIANQATGYNWTGPNNFWSNMQNPTLFNVNGADAGTYTVTATSQYGCTASATVNVVVNPTPVISVSSVSPLCAGDDIHLISAHNGTSLIWNGANNYSSIQQNPTITNVTTAMSGWYVATSYLGSCFASDSVQVTVNPTPNVSISASTTNICAGLPVDLTGNGASTYNWSNGANGPTTTVYPSQNSNYSVTGTNQHGCTGSATIAISINGNGILSEFNVVGYPKCHGGSDGYCNLHVLNGSYPYAYQWSDGTNGTSSRSGLSAGIYAVTITDANGCQGVDSITIVDPPTINMAYIPDGLTIYLNISGGSMLPGDVWQISSNPPAESIIMTTPGSFTIVLPAGTASVFITGMDGHLCTETITVFTGQSGIENNNGQNLPPIYFNNGNGTIVIPKSIPIDHVNVVCLAGGIPYTYTGNEHIISTNSLSPGFYIVQVTTDDGKVITSKFVK